jgi:ammonium transporter, Amt family
LCHFITFTFYFFGKNKGYGFNGGSAFLLVNNTVPKSSIAAVAVVNTTMSAATGGLCALWFNMYRMYRKDKKQMVYCFQMTINGILSGLVAISSACATVNMFGSLVIGAVAAIICFYGAKLIEHYRIDDVLYGIPVHFFNGIWSMIATGLLSTPHGMKTAYGTDKYVGLLYEFGRNNKYPTNGVLFTNQLIGVCFIIIWTAVTTIPIFIYLDYKGWLRSLTHEEVAGLDVSFHGGGTHEGKLEGEHDIRRFSRRSIPS